MWAWLGEDLRISQQLGTVQVSLETRWVSKGRVRGEQRSSGLLAKLDKQGLEEEKGRYVTRTNPNCAE